MDGILLCRVSDPKQEDKYSLAAQEREGEAYANRAGIKLVRKFIFQETASKANHRKKFDEILGFIYGQPSSKKLALLVEKHDRLSRNDKSKADIQHLIDQGRVVVHFFKDGKVLDQDSDPADFLVNDVMSSVSSYTARNIRRESLKGMDEKARQGWLPTKPPLGYVNQTVTLTDERTGNRRAESIIVPDPDARIVRWVQDTYRRRADGVAFAQIRKQQIAEGVVPAERVKTYSTSLVEKTIKNPFYEGTFRWRGKEYIGKHELFVDPDLIRRAHALEVRDTRRKRKHDGALSGWMTCAECGCLVTYDPKVKPSGRSYDYYRCTNGRHLHVAAVNPARSIPESKILHGFIPALEAIEMSGERSKQIADALDETHARVRAARQREIESFEAGIRETEEHEDRAYADFRAGILDEQGYRRQVEKARAERRRFEAAIKDAHAVLDDSYRVTAKRILELATKAKTLWLSQNAVERRAMLDRILSNPQLDGSSVRYQMKKPWEVVAKMAKSEEWRPHGDSNPSYRRERAVS